MSLSPNPRPTLHPRAEDRNAQHLPMTHEHGGGVVIPTTSEPEHEVIGSSLENDRDPRYPPFDLHHRYADVSRTVICFAVKNPDAVGRGAAGWSNCCSSSTMVLSRADKGVPL